MSKKVMSTVRGGALCAAVVAGAGCGGTAPTTTVPTRSARARPAVRPTTAAELRTLTAGGYRLVRLPVLTVWVRRGRPPESPQVFARFNRRMPVSGFYSGFGVFFAAEGNGVDDGSGPFGRPERHCYSNVIDTDTPPSFVAHPREGQVVPLEIRIDKVRPTLKLRVAVHVVVGSEASPLSGLGCGQ